MDWDRLDCDGWDCYRVDFNELDWDRLGWDRMDYIWFGWVVLMYSRSGKDMGSIVLHWNSIMWIFILYVFLKRFIQRFFWKALTPTAVTSHVWSSPMIVIFLCLGEVRFCLHEYKSFIHIKMLTSLLTNDFQTFILQQNSPCLHLLSFIQVMTPWNCGIFVTTRNLSTSPTTSPMCF